MELSARVRLPGSEVLDSDPTFQRMLEESQLRQGNRLIGRERVVVVVMAAAFLCFAIPFALLVPSEIRLDWPVAAALAGLYVLAMRIEFHTGAGWTDPTQLVFVPMLFLVPAPVVPVLIAVSQLLFRLPEFLRGSVPIQRAVIRVSDAWYAVGPAVVFAIAEPGAPAAADWPIYLAAFGAQLGFDLANSVARDRIGVGVGMTEIIGELVWIYFVDALLTAVGLMVAFASIHDRWAFVLVAPLLGLLAVFSRERQARFDNALTLSHAYRGTAHLLGELLETSDEYTGKHTRSVVVFAHQVGTAMGLSESELREVEFGALLHDVGKVAIPNELINKPGSLNADEWELMKTHPAEGARMLKRIGGVLAEVGEVVRHHHERWDGSGYPDGLAGEDIPIASRVISACDAYHAMTSDRSYRKALPRETAIAELRANAGTQFDPCVVEILIEVVEAWEGTSQDPIQNGTSREPAQAALVAE